MEFAVYINEILNELNITSFIEKVNAYKSKEINHVDIIPHMRLPQFCKNHTTRQKKSKKTHEETNGQLKCGRNRQVHLRVFPFKCQEEKH